MDSNTLELTAQPLPGHQDASYEVPTSNHLPPSGSPDAALAILCDEADQDFAETLLTLTKKNKFGGSFNILASPAVLQRFLALADDWFIYTLASLSHEDHIGVDLLFVDIVKRRVNTLPPDTFRGRFSMALRRALPGFDLRAYQQSLREQQQADRRQQCTPASAAAGDPDNEPPPEPTDEDPRPVICITTDMKGVVAAGQDAILALPTALELYQRGRRLVIITRGAPPLRWLARPKDMPTIAVAANPYIEQLAAQGARWVQRDRRRKKWVDALPPLWFVPTLQAQPEWLFPPLEGVICSPTLRPDGSVLDTPGYDPDTGLYLDTNGTLFPPISPNPTRDDARIAIGQLKEPIIDFLWAGAGHLSATLAAMLSLVCLHTIRGNVPLFAIRSTTRGSGKSLLADVIGIVGTGRVAPRWAQSDDDEEERKRLLTIGLAGYPCVHIDNVTRALGSPALNLAMTSTSFKDRILGKNEELEVPLKLVWLASGNNMQFKGDMARRVVPIDLDPKMERPEERTGFQYQLPAWVDQERPRLTIAALTILKAYFEDDCPSQDITPLGSFEQWSDLIRQALIWAGEADPCEGRKEIEARSDPAYEALASILHAWHACYGTEANTLKTVLKDINERAQHIGPETTANDWNALQDALGSCDPKYEGKTLRSEPIGYKLRDWQGRVIEGKRLISDGTGHAGAVKWRIDLV